MKKATGLFVIFILLVFSVPKKACSNMKAGINDGLSGLYNQSGNVVWSTYSDDCTYNGRTYSIQTLIAHPDQTDSNLIKDGSIAMNGKVFNIQMLTTQPDFINSHLLIFSDIIDTCLFSYSYATTVSFKYVKLKGQSDNRQVLSYVSAKGKMDVYYMYNAFQLKDKVYKPDVKQGRCTIYLVPSKYNLNTYAIKGYLDMLPGKSSVTDVVIKEVDGGKVFNINPVCPVYPSQVF